MAQGDMVVFEEARGYLIDGGFEAADEIKCALIDNTSAPTAADAVPGWAVGASTDHSANEVAAGGTYSAGGDVLATLDAMTVEVGGTVTFDDTDATLSWAQNGSNPTDAYWAIVYNNTDANKRAIAYLDLGGPINMATGTLTITWNANGIFQITAA